MIFRSPMPFREALDAQEVRSLLPTTGTTNQLQQLGASILRRSMFSAQITSVQVLDQINESVRALLGGDVDQATMRLGLKQLHDRMGYRSDPQDAGGLKDFASTARINLQLETNVATAAGYGRFRQSQDEAVLDEFPAEELYRAIGRGEQRDWATRWQQAGGEFYDERMIALKNDPVWVRLGDPDLFDDGLGNPYPPFAFNSGMRVRPVSRDDAVEMGLIGPDDPVFPRQLDLNADLKAEPDVRDATLRQLLEDSGLGRFDGGAFVFTQPGGPSS